VLLQLPGVDAVVLHNENVRLELLQDLVEDH
jgi:hypothetical protein